jgi:glycosyltransferase involved in cell wall biosynthesis
MTTAPVTAIIPVRNGAVFIGEALESVVGQSTPPAEVIVIDDGSEDETESVVRRFSDVIYQRQAALGQSQARNHGARLATQNFLAFLDADDLWERDKTRLQLTLMAERESLDLVSGQMVQFKMTPGGVRCPVSAAATANLPGLLLMKRETFWRVGPYSSALRVGEPIEWWSRAMDLRLVADSVPAVVLMRRIHESNLGRTSAAPVRDYLETLHGIVKRRRGDMS